MSKGFASNYRIVLLASALLIGFTALGTRLVWLHVVNRGELLQSIAKTRQRLDVRPARRGDILDARGAKLATSRSLIKLGVDRRSLRAEDETKWGEVARLLAMPEVELRQVLAEPPRTGKNVVSSTSGGTGSTKTLFSLNAEKTTNTGGDDENDAERGPRWSLLRDDVPEEVYAEIERLKIKALTAERIYRRAYPRNQLAAHVVGFVNREQQPVAGMEFYADFYLRGQDGWIVGERDGRNRELAQFRTRDVPHADGYGVQLSIDSLVQDLVEQELAGIAERFEPIKASIVVSDPRTGFILGMGNYPTFDPNEYNKAAHDAPHSLKNAGVADVYEPGSVFKIVATAGALEEKLVSPNTTFNCETDRIFYRGRTLGLPTEDHGFDQPLLTVAEIVAKSSNRGAAQLGMLLGEERFYRYIRAFGFGGTLGFPIGGEVPGLLRPVEKWDPIDITRIPMGHSISATVLQMHQAMSVIANDGVLLRPQIIRKIYDDSGDLVYVFRPEEIARVVSLPTARKMATLLRGVALPGGTAPEAAIVIDGEDFEVAGKTGTTQKLVAETLPDGRRKLRYSNQHHVASFVGFFPASDPQVAISVIVDEAKLSGATAYGGRVAMPSFKRISERLIPILRIKLNKHTAVPALLAATGGGRR